MSWKHPRYLEFVAESDKNITVKCKLWLGDTCLSDSSLRKHLQAEHISTTHRYPQFLFTFFIAVVLQKNDLHEFVGLYILHPPYFMFCCN